MVHWPFLFKFLNFDNKEEGIEISIHKKSDYECVVVGLVRFILYIHDPNKLSYGFQVWLILCFLLYPAN